MAQSFYWRSGNVQRFWDPNSEMGEGWLVVVSPKALKQMKVLGYKYYHQMVQREEKIKEYLPNAHYAYKVTAIE